MKLTVFLITITCLQVSAAKVFSQKINVSEKHTSLAKVLSIVQQQSGYEFFYDNKDIKEAGNISVEITNASVNDALSQLFKDKPFTYSIKDNMIVINKKDESILDKIKKFITPPGLITGIVTDEKGIPLPGLTVKIKGGVSIWRTNASGQFTISVPDVQKTILVFSYVGYKTQEFTVKGETHFNIKMALDLAKLDEVKVIAYGTTTKRTATGAIAGIDSTVLQNTPLNDPILAIEGRIPGLQITATSGLPGSAPNVLIRGVNSLNRSNNSTTVDPSNSPLYVVDGVPFVSNPLNATGVGANMGVYNSSAGALILSSPFKSINPADIESIEVLKDADATAIYGTRGANGVILITTKRPQAGNTKFDFDAYSGVGKVTKFVNTLNTQEYLAMRTEALKNDGITATASNSPDLKVWDQNAYTNWQKTYAGGNAVTTNIEGTLSGGNEQTRFLLNGGYRDQGTVTPGNFGLQQGSLRLNIDNNSLDKKFTAKISASYSSDVNSLFSTDPYALYTLAPNQPLYNPDGSLYFGGSTNPAAALLRTYQDRTKNLNSNLVLGYQFFKGFNFKVSLGYNRIQQDQLQINPKASYDPANNSTATRYQSTNLASTYLTEPQLNYTTQISKGTLQALLGGTYERDQNSMLFISGGGYTNDDLLNDIASATTLTLRTASSDYKYLAAFGRLNYNWDGKYIINATGRRDGSSRFGNGNRFGNFGAVGAAWIFTEEPWMKDLSFLSFGKLRGSYGLTGNDKIGDYQYYSTYQANSTAVYQTVGFISNKLANANLHWETNAKLEAAIELGFLKDRISITADYYRNVTGNSLVSYPLASQTGSASITQNLDAEIQNTGFEFTLSTVNIKSKSFTWNTNFNLSLQRNKLLSFPGLAGSPYNILYSIGQSISNIRGFVYNGVDPQTGAATYKDLNGNGVQHEFAGAGGNRGDQTIIANSLPDFYGGINNSFGYKGFELNVFFNFRKLDATPYYPNAFPGTVGNIDHSTLNRWQKVGDVTNTPRYVSSIFTSSGISQAYLSEFYLQGSSYSLVNGSFLRLSNTSLAYTLPKRWVQKAKFSNVKIYALAQNLFTISNFPGPDPETGLSMPALRIITLGVRGTF